MGPLLAAMIVRWMCRDRKKLSYEQIRLAAKIFNLICIVIRLDVPRSLVTTNFLCRTFIAIFSFTPCTLVVMNVVSAPVVLALEWGRMDPNSHTVELVDVIANETMAILISSIIVLHLSAVLHKQEMATRNLLEEISIKQQMVKETATWL